MGGIPESRRGARLRRRGDSPALPCKLKVVFASLRGRIRAAALEYIPGRNRVQAPAAPGFYRSCADALTDGFCPQSGLVQRGVINAACGGPPLVAGATTFLLKGSMSLDSQSPTAPYESSSFATPQAGAQQPVLKLEQLMRYQTRGALLSHRFSGGKVVP